MKTLIPAALAAMTLLAPLAAQAQTSQTYNGNGNSGFSGFLGKGSVTVSESTAGDITFALAIGGPNGPGIGGNVAVFYIDSTAGGFSNTSTFTDTGASANTPNGNADHIAISGFNTAGQRELVNFAPAFQADYAVAFQDGYLDLFSLSSSTPGALTYISGNSPSKPGAFTFTFASSAIGLAANQGFNFVGTLAAGNAYRSDEAIGSIDAANGNPGFNSTINYANFNTFAPPAAAPEPSGAASLLMGALVLGGFVVARRRTVSAK